MISWTITLAVVITTTCAIASHISSRDTPLGDLFPIQSLSNWTVDQPGGLPLSNATLNPFKVQAGPPYLEYEEAPDGSRETIHAFYPEGSYIPSESPRGGFGFYAPGVSSVDLTTAKEATFGYSVFYPDGFDFVQGGKIPGLYGGDNATVAVSCSGGRRDTACFSVRLMWRTDGAGELYTYLPSSSYAPDFTANDKICELPDSYCNPDYGDSIMRGSFYFQTGAWTTVTQRVRLNDVGVDNAELELFVNGVSVINVDGLRIRAVDEGRIRGMMMQTFFGGSTPDWAATKDEDAYFADFSVAITELL